MESSQSNKRPHSGDGNDAGGKRGKFSGRGRGGGSSFRGYAGGGGDGQRGRGFRGTRGGFRDGRGFGGPRGGRGGFKVEEGGGFRGGRGGDSGGFQGGRGGLRGREGGGFRGGRGGDVGGFRGGRGGFRGGEVGGFRGGRGGFRVGEASVFRGGRGGDIGGFRGGRGGEGGGFRGGWGGEGGGFQGGRGGGIGGFRGGKGGGRGGREREGGNSVVMYKRSGFKNMNHQVLVDFPEWSADLIHSLLNTVVRFSSRHGNADWGQVSQEMKGVLQPDELEYMWNKLNTKLEPPTFQDVLVYIKRALKKTVHCEKCPEVDGLPKTFCSPEEFWKQSGQRNRKMTPTERAPYYAAWIAEKANFELRWMNYFKDHPELFQQVSRLDNWLN